jgi:hypothetical protein
VGGSLFVIRPEQSLLSTHAPGSRRHCRGATYKRERNQRVADCFSISETDLTMVGLPWWSEMFAAERE